MHKSNVKGLVLYILLGKTRRWSHSVILFCFQMSGRAGRRGQDLLGDVYFFNIPLPKISKLIKSKVPELRGQFPLSISLILRLLLLASKADDLEDGKAKVLCLPAGATAFTAGLADITSTVLISGFQCFAMFSREGWRKLGKRITFVCFHYQTEFVTG